ncbi:MAG: nickel pincer cofactor biosynthesis protein LarC [Tissierellia bacterium]|nr:nickel pincer cofactor biosynthesis protein LarC [Tissierellia bacterium]
MDLYFDCKSGISGNMTIAALLEILNDDKYFYEIIEKLNLDGYELIDEKRIKNGIDSRYFNVLLEHDNHKHNHEHNNEHDHEHHHEHGHGHEHHHEHRNLKSIQNIIAKADFSQNIKTRALDIFERIAKAESKIHGISIDEVHFHEVGAVDAMIDIVGVSAIIEKLSPEKIYFSPLNIGTGFVNCAHGLFPVPAPATLEIIADANIPVYSTGIESELVTPTGAAICANLADEFGPIPKMTIEKISYGAGSKDLEIPNVLRVISGESLKKNCDSIIKIEANVDDMTGEELGYLMDYAMENGALDIFYTPIQMKKNRPGILISLLCKFSERDRFVEILFKYSTTIGMRLYDIERYVMQRDDFLKKLNTGENLRGKISKFKNIERQKFEFEDLKLLAKKYNISIDEAKKLARS